MERNKILLGCVVCLFIFLNSWGCGGLYHNYLPTLISETEKTYIWSIYGQGWGTPTNPSELNEISKKMVSEVCERNGKVIGAAIPPWNQPPARYWSVIVECDKRVGSQKSDNQELWKTR